MPSVTTVASVYTAPILTEVTLIVICNTTGSAAAFDLHHADDGGAAATSNAIYYGKSVGANDSLFIKAENANAGLMLKKDAVLHFRSGTADALTISVYGITKSIVGPTQGIT